MSAEKNINLPFIPRICIRCEQRGTFVIYEDRIECNHCGYMLSKEDGKPITLNERKQNAPTTDDPRTKLKASTYISHPEPISKWAESAFTSAQAYIERHMWDEALQALYRAIDTQPDFTDAHLWIARLLDDPKKQREHLTHIIAHQPNHMEAIRELMILDGKLSHDAVGINDAHVEPNEQEVNAAVKVETTNPHCPACGSPNMQTENGILTCDFCGYVDSSRQKNNQTGVAMLTAALLERRSQPVKWIVGEQFLDCNNCGAKRTIPARKLSERCPFCGSNHVIERDVIDSFTQPDGILPFVVTRKGAGTAIKSKLSNWTERVKGWFDNNTVKRATLSGVYLPYWVFDAVLEVRRTVFRQSDHRQDNRSYKINASSMLAYESTKIPDAIHNVAVCAVKSPPNHITQRLGKYDFSRAIDYDPGLLTRFSAELYSIDFDKASIMARKPISERMREKHQIFNNTGEQVNISTSVLQMHFRLLLVPVWIGTLYEEDDDIRSTLVNGQTGEVVLGRTQKPE